MAELNRQDIWPDDLLTAPLQYAANVEAAVKASEKLMQTAKASSEAISGSGSVGKAAKETEQLTQAQLELEKVNKQISIAQAKNNQEYLAQQEILADLKKEIRDKAALGEKEAKTVNAQNASIKELNAALRANRDAYDKLATAEQRNSEEGKKLLATIQEQDKELKSLKKEMGQNQIFVGEYENAMKGLKLELKAARDEMAGIASTLGADSPEFIAAAEKAGKLKDEINDINDAVKNTEASPFENLGNTFTDAGRKLLSLDFGGAANSARQFATASKAITFKEAIGGIKDLGKTFTTLGKALLTNPLFLIAAIVVAIGVAIFALKDKIPFLTKAFDAIGAAIDWVIQMLKDFGDWLEITSFAAEEKANRIVEAAKKEREALERRYDAEIKLAAAAGEQTSFLEAKKQAAIRDTAIASKKALDDYMKDSGTAFKNLTDEQKDAYAQAVKDIHDSTLELRAIILKEEKERRDNAEKARQERIAKDKEEAQLRAETAKWLTEYLASQPSAIAKREEEERKALEERTKDLNKFIDLELKTTKSANESILQARIALNDKLIEADRLRDQYLREQTVINLEETKKIYTDVTSAIGNLFSSITAARLQDIDMEKQAVTDQMNRELEMAGTNEAAKDEIRKEAERKQRELEKKRLEEQRKFAIFEKASAVIAAGINTALAITNQLAKGDPYTAFARAALAGALGAIQIAAIIAKPIPKFAVGTDNAPGGLAFVGERGTELIQTPSGEAWLTPNKATLTNLPKGSKVFTNDETMMMMAGISNFSAMKGDFVLYSKLGSLEQTIKMSDAKIVDAIERSNNKILTQGNLVYEIKKKHDGSRQMIRSKSLN